jgi:hypothetical protein
MTQLVEDITIKIALCHCEADSTVLGGKTDLREIASNMVQQVLYANLKDRVLNYAFDTLGVSIRMENTGLYEAPEVGGGDN